MINQDFMASKNRIDALIEKTKHFQIDTGDIKMLSEWTKYIGVLVCGLLEKGIYYLLLEYSKKNANENVVSYVDNNFKKFTNPTMGKIEDELSKFNKNWVKDLQASPNYQQHKEQINSLVKQRNLIAHGNKSDFSQNHLKQYYQTTIQFLSNLEQIV